MKRLLVILALLAGTAWGQTLDTYGGLTALPCTGGATGYFYTENHAGRWLYCSPLGNGFWQFASYNETTSFLQTAPTNILTVKYGGNKTNWAVHNNQRLLSWNFNTIGEYALTYVMPVNTNGSHTNANTVKLPFIPLINALPSMITYPTTPAGGSIAEAPKNMILGVPSTITVYRGGRMTDMFDPKVATAYTNIMHYQNTTSYTDGFASTPWILGITPDDTDYLFGIKNRGDAPVSPHPNIGFIAAVTKFDYSTLGTYIDPVMYSKYAWTCGRAGIDFGYGVGKGYLDNKYGTIGALNTAWGTSGFYTSFCDAGGYGTGTGVLDEDGRHTTWMGADSGSNYVAYVLQGTSAGVVTDVNQFVYDYAYKYSSTAITAIRSVDTHHMIFGPASLSGDGYEDRPQVLQAFAAAGVNVFQLAAPAGGNDFSGIKATYDLIGKPIYLWYAIIANNDSALTGYTSTQGAPDYGTQANRATHYNSHLNSFLAATGTDGKHYIIGIDWWEHTDGNFAEKTNWGLVTDRDNPYDGYFSTTTAHPDGAYTSIPEFGNWGNFISGVTAVNLNVLNRLTGVLSITSGACPPASVAVFYTCNLTAAGGVTPYTWNFSAGGLSGCTGLSLTAGGNVGVISGIPTVPGSCSFTEQVTDSTTPTPLTATMPNSITVSGYPPLLITTGPCPNGTIFVAYAGCTQSYTGGNGSNTWSLASGSLPAGLTISSTTGAITGTPTAAGPFSFTTQVVDTETPPQIATQNQSITVASSGTLIIVTGSLPNAVVGRPYSATLTATGGTPPYSWAVTTGAPPSPLSLSSGGVLSGTLTHVPLSPSPFTVEVTDAVSSNATQRYALSVLSTPGSSGSQGEISLGQILH